MKNVGIFIQQRVHSGDDFPLNFQIINKYFVNTILTNSSDKASKILIKYYNVGTKTQ